MTVDPEVQADFERNLLWQSSWPRCILAIIASIEIILAAAICTTEVFNLLINSWYMNVFGGFWASAILLTNWILIFVHVCCKTTVAVSTCSFVWHWITLVALGVLIVFDIVFIVNPSTCILTSTCTSQTSIASINYLLQKVSQFSTYSTSDSKKFFLEIQVGCAGLAFILTIVYIVIFIVCRVKFQKRTKSDSREDVSQPTNGARVAPTKVSKATRPKFAARHFPRRK